MKKTLLTIAIIFQWISFLFSQQYEINIVKTFSGEYGSNFQSFIEANGKLYFSTPEPNYGQELWVSDGTTSGTDIVSDIIPGNNGTGAYAITSFDGKIFFSGDSPQHNNTYGMYVSDGTEAGTTFFHKFNATGHDFISTMKVVNDKLYIIATDTESDYSLFVLDNSSAVPYKLKDINPIGNDGVSLPVSLNNTLFFFANDGINGQQLWSSDGTEAGTTLFKIINQNTVNSNADIILYENYIYFSAIDANGKYQLWKSDGTENGTQLFKTTDTQYPLYGNHLNLIYNGKLYFTLESTTTGVTGKDVWVTDGTENGTHLFYSPFTEGHNSIDFLLEYDNKLVFSFYNYIWSNDYYILDYRLNISDGTIAGTELMDIVNLPSFMVNTYPKAAVLNNELYIEGYLNEGKGALYKITPSTLNVSSIELENLMVYPNPTLGDFTISFGRELTNVTISISDLTGKIILEEQLSSAIQGNFSITGQAGMYFVNIKSEQGTSTKMILKNE